MPMFEFIQRLFEVGVKKRIEESPANFALDIDYLELKDGRIKIRGKVSLDFPEDREGA